MVGAIVSRRLSQIARRNHQRNKRANQPRSQTPTVTLRPMAEEEYQHLRSWLDEDYAQEVAKAMGVSIEEGREAAQKQLGELLPEGLKSEGHHFWKITTEDGACGRRFVGAGRASERARLHLLHRH